MSTPEKNIKKQTNPQGQISDGITRVNNLADGKCCSYQKPTITLINKPGSLKKADSPACALCDAYCQECDVCDGWCVSCDVCDGCEVCDGYCDICDAGCDICVTCDAGCDVCVGCDICDGGCDVCVGCDICDGGCDVCVGCDICDAGCDACVGCDSCDGCVGCDICNAGCDACVSCVDCETCVVEDTSLPVTLTAFDYTRRKNSVRLYWKTEAEVNNLGFFLFRALAKEGPYQPLNTKIIPGAGSSSAAHEYEYVDQNVDSATTYWYLLEDVDINGESKTMGPLECKALSGSGQASPTNFRLSTNYPNPFNSQTSLSVTVPESGYIEAEIYDVSGRAVKTLLKGNVEAGTHSLIWDATNNSGAAVTTGVYFCRVRFESGEILTAMQKMSYVR